MFAKVPGDGKTEATTTLDNAPSDARSRQLAREQALLSEEENSDDHEVSARKPCVCLTIAEDNQAVIRSVQKGRSPTCLGYIAYAFIG